MFTLITCGGTIDKIYFDKLSDYSVGESHVQSLLRSFDQNLDFIHIPLFQKDSLDMTDRDRNKLKSVVQEADSDCLITHGTDTMIQSAQELVNLNTRHRIVLTGAMQPYLFKTTDAVFNVGFALGVMRSSTEGVYIAIHGEVFSSFNTMRKDRVNQRFLTGEENEIVPVDPNQDQ
jgi:L-asparaginase